MGAKKIRMVLFLNLLRTLYEMKIQTKIIKKIKIKIMVSFHNQSPYRKIEVENQKVRHSAAGVKVNHLKV